MAQQSPWWFPMKHPAFSKLMLPTLPLWKIICADL
jgi:hypothetical protein